VARRLKTLAKEINKLSGYTAEIVEGYCNTDSKIPGTRFRRQGKGRYGNRLIVKNAEGEVVLDHNAAETYRHNGEVEEWIEYVKKHGKPYNPFARD
jgi:hypothetical protein